MQTPSSLLPGDTIAIVAPSRAIKPEALEYTIKIIEQNGFVAKIGSSIGLQEGQYAGSDRERAQDINNMFADKSVKAIWCARGGYGSVRTLQYVDFELVRDNPKWFIGYSDITVFHSTFHSLDFETIHATMPVNIASNSDIDNVNSLFEILKGKRISYKFASHDFNIGGDAVGQLVGGNLSVLYSLRNTPVDLDTAGKILFLEDLDEYLYHIDRMMMNLKYSGFLKNLKGLIVGGLSDMKDNTIPFGKNAEEIVLEHACDLGISVCFGFNAGHTNKNLALPLGREVKLIVAENECRLVL
jgi:muramoyltetrapeptide carboxypeptidase